MEKKPVKIVTIGGGSSYTPELMEGFIKRYDELPIREIWLVDIEDGKEKLEIVGAMAQRMWDASPYDVKVHLTLDRREALKNADFVTTQFRVGLLNARIKDERIPLSYGMLGQETNGAGGMFKALRTIPVILDIVEDMKELCPDAWLINFTNPSGMVTEAVMRYGKWDKVIGLCNVPVGAMMKEPQMIHKTLDELTYKFAGLNHFHWHKIFDNATGNDITQKIIDAIYDPDVDDGTPKNIFNVKFFKEQLDQMQMIPCGYHRYYYRQEEMLKHSLEEYHDVNIGTRGQQVKKTEAELFELYKDPNLNYKPEEIEQRILEVSKLLKIEPILDKKIEELTISEKKKLCIALALLHHPKVLLLDQPFSMLSKADKTYLIEVLKTINKKEKTTIILATNQLEDTIKADYLYILNNGKIVIEGSPLVVMTEDKLLNRLGLELPFMVDLSLKLKFYDLLDEIIIDMDRMVNELWK